MKYLVVYVIGNDGSILTKEDCAGYVETHTVEYYSVERLIESMIYKWKTFYKDLYIESIYRIEDEEENFDFESEINKPIKEQFDKAKSNIIKEEKVKAEEDLEKKRILEVVTEKELYRKLKEKFE